MLRRLVEAFGAWRRGERRVALAEARGRVYARSEDGSAVVAKMKPKPSISARIWRAEEGAWYRLNEKTGELEKE